MSSSVRAGALLVKAEACLARRECSQALTAFDWAELAGAEEDRCAAGRWMASMLLGQYEQAWHESDAIRQRVTPDPHRFWQGEPIDGRRVMVRCLHGYGDTVMYLRWLRMLNQRASQVLVQAAPEMLPLLRCMPEARQVMSWTAQGESDREHWDVQVESAELPYLFRTTPQTLPPPVRLQFPEAQQHRVRMRLGESARPRVGLVWTGSNYDSARSIAFVQLQGLLRNRAVDFWSLQAPENNTNWLRFCAEHGWGARTFYTHGEAAEEVTHAGIADMAAFAPEMDLVITIDTLAAHIAGSLGLPTWLLLKREADWRWMIDRSDTPWYPTMTLFRQTTSGDWSGVLGSVCDRLRDRCEEQKA